MNQAKANEALAKALVEKFVREATAEEQKRRSKTAKTKKSAKAKKASGSKGTSSSKSAPQKTKTIQPKAFIPLDGHMTVEEFFRYEIPYEEFCYYLDCLIADSQAHIVLLDKKSQFSAQHRINVVSVFEQMLKANPGTSSMSIRSHVSDDL